MFKMFCAPMLYMESFHIIVLSVATVVLILLLIFIGILLSKGNTNLAFPPSYGICPDYWELDEKNKKCIIPPYSENAVNIGSIYGADPGPNPSLVDSILTTPGYSYEVNDKVVTHYIDFHDSAWTGTCSKQKWANEHGIVWDGVSNYNNC